MAKRNRALPKKDNKHKRSPKTYGEKEVDFSTVLPMVDGYEKIFILFYAMVIPYVTGVIFLFIFVAKARIDNFLSLDLAMFLVVWAIGYEIVASFTLMIIFYKMISFKHVSKPGVKTVIEKDSKKELYKIHKLS